MMARNIQHRLERLDSMTENILDVFGLPDKPGVVNNLAPVQFNKDNLHATLKNLKHLGLDPKDMYVLNGHGLRSDNFTKKHDGKHVVFAGCSITAGEGLPLEFTWPKIIYNKLSKHEKLSGYFNVAQPGATPIDTIHQVITYCGEFGNPDVIFINLPDIDREKRYLKLGAEHIQEETSVATGMQVYGYYSRLINFCKARNIVLVPFTWDNIEVKTRTKILDLRREFPGLGYVTGDDINPHVFNFKTSYPDHPLKKYFYVALDETHPGIAVHDYYAKLAYDMYEENNAKKD